MHCKIRSDMYLLTCKNCGIQCVGESITPVNARMNIHRKGKSSCEYSINRYKMSANVSVIHFKFWKS